MKTVLITGVTGFIGRYIARQFFDAGWSVVGLGTRPQENAPNQALSHYYQLLLPSNELTQIIQQVQPQICIHCIGRASVGLSVTEPNADFKTSVEITFQLLDTLRLSAPSCKTIYLSSAAVYGNPRSLPIAETHETNPISPYGFHKLICEQLCQEFYKIYQLPTAIVRIFSAYGPGLRRQVIWDICHKSLTESVVKLKGTGNESRDFIHVIDVAKAIQTISECSPCQGDTYNLASGLETKIKKLPDLILPELERKIEVEFDGIVPTGDPLNWQANINRLTNLGFTPEVSLARGLKVYAQWCRAEVLGW